MMPFSAIIAVLLLLAIALVHLLWALGSSWPVGDEKTLARTVVGSKDIQKMPPRLASLGVAIVLTAAAHIVLASGGLMPGILLPRMYQILLVAMILVFSARGLVAYMSFWRELVPEQPFARLDQRIYAPLCLLIAALLLDVALT
ncbi:DUF3995 domain-containing protein [Parasedimentitalea maritima]|uniref:DUF3995 domain-containing protein n=1 Tax=Parasedimentitalea maritima TaxID=2578117 RepID=A0A6A4RIX4_9RHOB|nr:DUF3995 domain-containing protein [Zongyanglinia marina]KAE9631071.1 DUF3995 domain-containing protein [Zongyanglinia marina]